MKHIKNLPIQLKLFALTVFLGSVMGGIVVFALVKINALNQELQNNVNQSGRKLVIAFSIKLIIVEIESINKDFILSRSESELESNNNLLVAKRTELARAVKELALSMGEDKSVDFEEIESILADWSKQLQRVVRISSSSVREGHSEGDLGVALSLDQKAVGINRVFLAPLREKLEAPLDKILRENFKDMRMSKIHGRKEYHEARLFFSVVALTGILFGVVGSYLIGQSIAIDLRALTRYAQEVAFSGDLSQEPPKLKGDEIGELSSSFGVMRKSILAKDRELLSINNTLVKKNAEIEQYVYTVSHDLKSPLVTARGFVGFMKEDLAQNNIEAVFDSARRIDESCQQMSNIIDDLLELSKIGRDSEEFRKVDIGALLEKVEERYKSRLEKNQIELVIESELPKVFGSSIDIERALDNLVGNALKYACQEKGGKIFVGNKKTVLSDDLYIRDQGPGISSEFHEKIFGLFQRLEKGKEGTGLGLASVRKVMDSHGGAAWVESEIGQGATFWLSFPK